MSQVKAFELVRYNGPVYPDQADLETLLEVHSPSIILLDVSDVSRAVAVVQRLHRLKAAAQVVVISRRYDAEVMLTAMRAGIREYLTPPFPLEEVREALSRLNRLVSGMPERENASQHVFSFLPAKPGVGASTICLNTARSMASRPGTRTALLDFDFYCGSLDFALQLPAGHSVSDAMDYAESMNDVLWKRLVTEAGNLHVLRSGRPAHDRLLPVAKVMPLLRYARRHYDAVFVDLAGGLDPCSFEVLEQSNRIFLVGTPEVASLHMVRRMLGMLEEMGLGGRVSVLINRMEERTSMGQSQIEELLDHDVLYSIPNDYAAVQRSVTEADKAPVGGALGKRYEELARLLLPDAELPPQPKKQSLWGSLNLFASRAAAGG
ncbi:MAG: hypothetical protein HY235_22610 [Acidobacteria bacterium]|nr:hypothetical protein [Acidobacteriota bacterium]